MSRERYVAFIRYLLTFVLSLTLLLPLTLILIDLTDHLFLTFPTLHLLMLASSIIVTGIALSFLAPAIKNLITQHVFTGSYDYDQKLKNLASQIAEDPNLNDRIAFCTNSLQRILGGRCVTFGSKPDKNCFNISVPSQTGPRNWLVFANKFNHDPWTKKDRRRLNWFSSSVAVTLNLERQRHLEKKRLSQIKKKVILSSASLKKLNQELIQREKDLALQFDELAHDLKNPIAITLNIFNELKQDGAARPDNQKHILANLLSESAWMDKSTGHLLDLARAEANKIKLKNEPLDFFGAIQDTLDYLQDYLAAQERIIEWSPLTNHVTDVKIVGDDKLIHQLLKLLFTWTIRHTKNRLTLSLTTDLTDSYVFLDLIMRPPTKIRRTTQADLLDQFTRSWNHHRDRRYGITGMELALAKWILKEHQGALSITESDNERVVLRAALKASQKNIKKTRQQDASATQSQTRQQTIL